MFEQFVPESDDVWGSYGSFKERRLIGGNGLLVVGHVGLEASSQSPISVHFLLSDKLTSCHYAFITCYPVFPP